MYKVINGKDVLCCDICENPVSMSDKDACIGTMQYISKPNVRQNGVEEHHFRNICGSCIYDEELIKIWRERAKERCLR